MRKLFLCLMVCLGIISLHAEDTTLHQYTGTYTFPEGGPITTVDISLENGSLLASSTAGSSPLEWISTDTFNLVTYSGKVYFTRDSTKKVSGIKIIVEETILEGKKESADLAVINYSKYAAWNRKYRSAYVKEN